MKRSKLVFGVVIGLFLLILLLQNTAPVQTRILSASFELPLALTLFAGVAAGFGLGWIVCWARMRRRFAGAGGKPAGT